MTEGRVFVFLVLLGADAKPHFRALFADRPAIDRELGLTAVWDEKLDRKESHVRVEHMRGAGKRVAPLSSDVPQRQLGQADLATTQIRASAHSERG